MQAHFRPCISRFLKGTAKALLFTPLTHKGTGIPMPLCILNVVISQITMTK